MDRSWMKRRFDNRGLTSEFERGVDEFLNFAYSNSSFVSMGKIKCPCRKCKNLCYHNRDDVTAHLYAHGFLDDYIHWVSHGESIRRDTSLSSENTNPYRQMVMQAVSPDFDCDSTADEPNIETSKFYSLLNAIDEPIWEGCKKHTKLSAMSQLLNLKSECHMSDKGFDRLLSTVKDMLPENDKLANNFYETKKLMKMLGLKYEKIDVCINNCMLYYKENVNKVNCSVCGHDRFKTEKLTKGGRNKGIPYKVLRYLPLTPRLQRLYMSEKTAKHMTWYASHQYFEGYMSHPSDGEAWKHFDEIHPSFASDPRNV